MAKLIFRLRDVEIDEVIEVKQLLEDNDLAVYETDGGMFGLSIAGLWLIDTERYQEAKTLLADYAEQRALTMKPLAPAPWWSLWLQRPVQGLLVIASISLIIFFSLWPFLQWGKP